jgi:hypothetical protein
MIADLKASPKRTEGEHSAGGGRGWKTRMNKATLARLRKLEVSAQLEGSVDNLTDEQLFSRYRDLIEKAGGAEAYAAALRAEGEDSLADDVLRYASCRTAAEFMACRP